MADLTKRQYEGQVSRLQQDTERGMARLRGSIDSLDASSIPYTPGDPADWVEPLPATVQEALDRMAANPGSNPVP